MPRAVIASASDRPSRRGNSKIAPLGFPPACRLLRAADFSAVFEKRKVLRGRWFAVHLRPRTCGEGARLGLVVPKKLLRTAVARNLAKRLVREAFRQRRAALPDCDYVFRLTARPGPDARHVDRLALRGEVATLFARCAGAAPRPVAAPDSRA